MLHRLTNSCKSHARAIARDDDDDGDEFGRSDVEAHAMDAALRTSPFMHSSPQMRHVIPWAAKTLSRTVHATTLRSKILSAETVDNGDIISSDNFLQSHARAIARDDDDDG